MRTIAALIPRIASVMRARLSAMPRTLFRERREVLVIGQHPACHASHGVHHSPYPHALPPGISGLHLVPIPSDRVLVRSHFTDPS